MQVADIILEEREERALRKAEMEAQKVGGAGGMAAPACVPYQMRSLTRQQCMHHPVTLGDASG